MLTGYLRISLYAGTAHARWDLICLYFTAMCARSIARELLLLT